MSETKHTPTPWRLGRNGVDFMIFQGEDKFVADCESTDENCDGTDEDCANAAFIVRAVNSHQPLVDALDTIFSRISYVNIHGVGSQPDPDPEGNPQPIRVSLEEFHHIWKEIGDIAAAALKLAEADQ